MPNESLIHADVFFFISTIALVGISIGICIALYYLIHILRNVREVSDKVKAEGTEIIADLKRVRLALKEEGMKWKYMIDMVTGFFIRKNKTKKHGK